MSGNLKVKEPDIMKPLFAFGLLVVALPVAAQVGSQHALGGAAAGRAQSHPLGGIVSPSPSGRRGAPVRALPYAYSFYVPNYFDNYGYADQSYAAAPPSPVQAPPPQAYAPPLPPPPVIINQYFGGPPPGMQQQVASEGPPPVQQEHYLLAFKNHSVYEVTAYWIEDKTMHYVTAGNKHNQAALDQVDQDLTKTLNDGR